jgi:hypothetical protein
VLGGLLLLGGLAGTATLSVVDASALESGCSPGGCKEAEERAGRTAKEYEEQHPSGVTAPRPTLVPVPWDALEVGPSGRSIIVFGSFGCMAVKPHATVTEAPTTLMLSVSNEEQERQGPAPPCAPVERAVSFSVALVRPLAGRTILGRWLAEDGLAVGLNVVGERRKVPRLIGFSPADATHALSVLGLRPHVCYKRLHGASLSRVVSQRPALGGTAAKGGTVLVVVGTDAQRLPAPCRRRARHAASSAGHAATSTS